MEEVPHSAPCSLSVEGGRVGRGRDVFISAVRRDALAMVEMQVDMQAHMAFTLSARTYSWPGPTLGLPAVLLWLVWSRDSSPSHAFGLLHYRMIGANGA